MCSVLLTNDSIRDIFKMDGVDVSTIGDLGSYFDIEGVDQPAPSSFAKTSDGHSPLI